MFFSTITTSPSLKTENIYIYVCGGGMVSSGCQSYAIQSHLGGDCVLFVDNEGLSTLPESVILSMEYPNLIDVGGPSPLCLYHTLDKRSLTVTQCRNQAENKQASMSPSCSALGWACV